MPSARAEVPILLLVFVLACVAPTVAQSAAPEYGREVRPILARCFACHGPDAAAREGDTRLDRPGQADLGEVLRRIRSADPGERMPPPEAGDALSAAEIEVLARWIEAGATYAQHWAFVPPELPSLPEPTGAATHPIDRFVDRRLAVRGLTRAPRADLATLARRVSLDLVGLPPAPERLAALLDDDRPDAYERFVDELLASPQYGERQARRWLDLARYADTHGYEKDRPRSMWPYRDQVIRDLNADMPYDEFVVRQLAGDMLPGATLEDRIASGFHRNTMINEEGGIDPLEFRYHALTDRVATTGTALLGLTLGCAQCHTHKFDPITHSEYFGILAFFDQADEPEMVVPDAGSAARQEADRARAAELARDLVTHWPADAPRFDQEFDAWLTAERDRTVVWTPLLPTAVSSDVSVLHVEPDADRGERSIVFASGDTTKHDVYELWFAPAPVAVRTLRIEALPDPRLPADGPGTTWYEGPKGDFFVAEIRVFDGERPVPLRRAAHADEHGLGVAELAGLFDGDMQTGWSGRGRAGVRHVLAVELAAEVPAGTALRVVLDQGRHYAASLGRFRVSASDATGPGLARALPADVEALLAAGDPLDAAGRERLRTAYAMRSPRLKEHADRVRALRDRRAGPTTLVMRERAIADRRVTRRRHRGEYLQPREPVAPHTPEALHAWPAELPTDRLGFARWLVSAENPLFDRVVVNRDWALFFGRGLVDTVDDFGVQGAAPTHPELLDWLAVTFRDDGRSRKRLHRWIVTSEAYRQDSAMRPDAAALDPENRLLWRAPRLRLDAEVLRDAALAAAGMLSPRMYGPPVRPPQPDGVTEIAFGSPRWRAGAGEDRVRRSIYTFHKRTAPFALFQTFDAPDGETCVARRERSNTPLQALSLLNDPQMVEIARGFGARLAARCAAAGDGAAIDAAFLAVVGRSADAVEREALLAFVAARRAAYAADPVAARAAVGAAADAPADAPDADLAERATWTALARLVLSLDEAITRN